MLFISSSDINFTPSMTLMNFPSMFLKDEVSELLCLTPCLLLTTILKIGEISYQSEALTDDTERQPSNASNSLLQRTMLLRAILLILQDIKVNGTSI